jgi:hypothetical protein
MQRDRGQCFIQVEAAVVDHMRAMRRPGENYSQVILRLVELETSDPRAVRLSRLRSVCEPRKRASGADQLRRGLQ